MNTIWDPRGLAPQSAILVLVWLWINCGATYLQRIKEAKEKNYTPKSENCVKLNINTNFV